MVRLSKSIRQGMVRLSGRIIASAAMASLLPGCAVVTAPGFDYTDPGLRTSVTLGQYVPSDVDNPPEGVIIPITPSLIQAQSNVKPRNLSPEVKQLFGEPDYYKIGPGDVLGITVFDHPELMQGAGVTTPVTPFAGDPTGIAPAPGIIVPASGQISFPYAGLIVAAGKTELEIQQELTVKLARVYKDPQVAVRIQAFRSKRVYVDGEVRNPGLQVFTDMPMTLPEAINRAGGVTPAGDRSLVSVTRADKTVPVNLMALLDMGVDPNKIVLRSGDMVTVKSREESKVYVMGEVLRPSAVLMRNSRLTLNDALGEVGGVNPNTANPRQVYVIRNNDQGQPAIFHLDAKTATALAMADGFALKPKDVVYVDPVPLVQWSRIINLILPTAQLTSGVNNTFR
ncbi:polysaccharide biosynthesis/export family protein [Variovorax terrae]|uniref:Polysaccharide biosynthesis/export family protein n=1 Tax=Variovorax terrae TaxID=2923278 RepID=A0A9X1VW47_9BURK|nr:polysaccharide biosynthesis/export family protein [Variovorax terrae]MCJ0764335.1 polysaccharide biosynthesis/export family protein [Variovorax terrae]